MSRRLTTEEIDKLASRKGVRSNAVLNFLSSVPLADAPPYGAHGNAAANLKADASMYKWNAPTVKAIRDGLAMIFEEKQQTFEEVLATSDKAKANEASWANAVPGPDYVAPDTEEENDEE